MPQYDLNGIDHIDIVEIPQNTSLEEAIGIINQNLLSLSQIGDINFVDFITKKIEQRISKGEISTNNIGKPGRDGRILLDDNVKKSVITQGSEFITYNKFGRNVFLTLHLVDFASSTQFDVPNTFLPITSNNVVETKLLSTGNGDIVFNSETNKIYKSGNLSGDIVLTYLSKHSSSETSNNVNLSDKQDKIDETLTTVSKEIVGAINELLIDISKKMKSYHLDSFGEVSGTDNSGKIYYDMEHKSIYQVDDMGVGIYYDDLHTGTIYEISNHYYKWNTTDLVPIGQDIDISGKANKSFIDIPDLKLIVTSIGTPETRIINVCHQHNEFADFMQYNPKIVLMRKVKAKKNTQTPPSPNWIHHNRNKWVETGQKTVVSEKLVTYLSDNNNFEFEVDTTRGIYIPYITVEDSNNILMTVDYIMDSFIMYKNVIHQGTQITKYKFPNKEWIDKQFVYQNQALFGLAIRIDNPNYEGTKQGQTKYQGEMKYLYGNIAKMLFVINYDLEKIPIILKKGVSIL